MYYIYHVSCQYKSDLQSIFSWNVKHLSLIEDDTKMKVIPGYLDKESYGVDAYFIERGYVNLKIKHLNFLFCIVTN